MGRLIWFVALSIAWVVTLVIVAAFAGWTFSAVSSARVVEVSDPMMRGVDAHWLVRFVGGRVVQVPFDIVSWTSVFMPAILISLLGGTSAKIDWSLVRWRRRCALVALSLAFLCAITSLEAGIRVREASHMFWECAGSVDAARIEVADDALFAAHFHARNLYVALIGCAAATAIAGSLFLARRALLVSRT